VINVRPLIADGRTVLPEARTSRADRGLMMSTLTVTGELVVTRVTMVMLYAPPPRRLDGAMIA